MKKILLWIINLYRKNISPNTPPSCRYNPTCSKYALESIEKFGALKGFIATVWRILRCNPFSKGGIDFVPKRFLDIFIKKTKTK